MFLKLIQLTHLKSDCDKRNVIIRVFVSGDTGTHAVAIESDDSSVFEGCGALKSVTFLAFYTGKDFAGMYIVVVVMKRQRKDSEQQKENFVNVASESDAPAEMGGVRFK